MQLFSAAPTPSRISRETSALDAGRTLALPEKRRSPCREILSRWNPPSPKTQRRASSMLLFPLPLGPTIAVKPGEKRRSWEVPKLLKPLR